MKQQNRPYSSIQVCDNLHNRVQKAAVERILPALSEPGFGLRMKEYGKSKIFFLDQVCSIYVADVVLMYLVVNV
jgi:hypothetical protein